MMKDPELYFNFMDTNGIKKPMLFKDPIDIICVTAIEDVLPSLEKVQSLVEKGYYAAGYVTYEAAPAFDSEFHVNPSENSPILWFGIFVEPLYEELQSTGSFSISEWTPSESVNDYQSNIKHIKKYIEQGNTYQVNYTIRLNALFSGDAKAYYQQLARAQSANYSAFIQTANHTILSASPELFFQKYKGKMITRPMKGTIKRGKTYKDDCEKVNLLTQSEKDRAENVMIVDLLRNDLGTIAKPGSVQVPELFSIEKYPTVYQMTSTVTANVDENKSITDVFKALFPCGSITGAPKISTMKIIQELETSARGVYCGAIGFITPDHKAIFNVPIRTVTIDHADDSAMYGVGGGITWDSTSDGEYEEILTKAALLKRKQPGFQLLESLGLIEGTYLVLENHFERLINSANYFDYPLDLQAIRAKLMEYISTHSKGRWKIRLLVEKSGQFSCEAKEISENPAGEVNYALAHEAISSQDVFLYHKTTNRSIYENARLSHPDVYDVLLWNEKREVTEFTGGNVVVQLNGKLYTPPIECGLLSGTFRKQLVDSGEVEERVVLVEELNHCENMWFVNSVREWIKVSNAI